MEKVHDHVNLNLLLLMLRKMGFRKGWFKWIE